MKPNASPSAGDRRQTGARHPPAPLGLHVAERMFQTCYGTGRSQGDGQFDLIVGAGALEHRRIVIAILAEAFTAIAEREAAD